MSKPIFYLTFFVDTSDALSDKVLEIIESAVRAECQQRKVDPATVVIWGPKPNPDSFAYTVRAKVMAHD